MRMENFSLLERLFINHDKSLSRIVVLESIGGQDGLVGYAGYRSFVPRVLQVQDLVWSRLVSTRTRNRVSLLIFWFSLVQNSERIYGSLILFDVSPPVI